MRTLAFHYNNCPSKNWSNYGTANRNTRPQKAKMEPRNHQQEAIFIPRLEEQKEKSVVNPGQGDLEEAGTLTREIP